MDKELKVRGVGEGLKGYPTQESRDFAADETPECVRPRESGYLPIGGIWCREPHQGLVCTRERGHDGEHAAHGPDKEMWATWTTKAA